jgi:hypothetical protein
MLLALLGVSVAVDAIHRVCGKARDHVEEVEKTRYLIAESKKIELLSQHPKISGDLLSPEDQDMTILRMPVLGALLLDPLERTIIEREDQTSPRWKLAVARGISRARERGIK